jgi:polysaccharide deacetylase family protein (PEP-CTERM system associated)
MNSFFLTLDFEEWYHLDYVNKKDNNFEVETIQELGSFFSILDKYNIKITVFVLGELISKHAKLIQKISDNGHEIAIHGWNHDLLNSKDQTIFLNEICKTKKELEVLIGKEVRGYRSPCFSIDNIKLEALAEIGITYDSSYIKFSDHPLYGDLSMNNFRNVDDLIYKKKNFFEFELPTFKLFNRYIPISGGGYFRLFPIFLLKFLFNIFLKNNNNFVMYLHPFELTNLSIKVKKLTMLNNFRFNVGRNSSLDKLDWLLKFYIDKKFQFITMSEYIDMDK